MALYIVILNTMLTTRIFYIHQQNIVCRVKTTEIHNFIPAPLFCLETLDNIKKWGIPQ